MIRVSPKTKLKVAIKNMLSVLRLPQYAGVAIISAVIISLAIVWSLNYELVGYILFDAPLGLLEKFRFLSYGYDALFDSIEPGFSAMIIVLSILFGINTSLLIYALALRRSGSGAASQRSGAAAILAVISGGCAACGTSLLAPLLATLGATSATLAHNIGIIASLVGIMLLIYSIYAIALQIDASNPYH